MSSKTKGGRMPFEPRQNKKKKLKQAATPSQKVSAKPKQADRSNAGLATIPDVVSKRMARRMALFCGIPTAMGMSSFFVFYWILSHKWLELPPYFVLFVTLSLFGLGFLGLSYGIFSASWDENRVGSWWGLEEFKLNWGRMGDSIASWRTSRKQAKGD
ncbi:PAM68 family protein [Pleurocapsales cyanobacterium LEGE 06147]|nr:PAM68 family protein [Pleurocapsales cyanobacterium LEGE 06147]